MSEPTADDHPRVASGSQLPREGKWLLSTVAVQLFGRGLTLPFTVIYLHEVRGIGLDVAGLLMAWIFAVGVLVTGPGGAAVDRFGARLVTLVACLVHMVGRRRPGLRRHGAGGDRGHHADGCLRRHLAGVQRDGRRDRRGAAAPAVLRRQLRPGQPRHRPRRHRQRLLRRRVPARDVHRDLPRRRRVPADPGRAAARAAAPRACPRRQARGHHGHPDLLPPDPPPAGDGLAAAAHLHRHVRRLRPDGGGLPGVRPRGLRGQHPHDRLGVRGEHRGHRARPSSWCCAASPATGAPAC